MVLGGLDAGGRSSILARHNEVDPFGLYVTSPDFGYECPNYQLALERALTAAGCAGRDRPTRSCRCQDKLKSCGKCDICRVLNDGVGPWLTMFNIEASGYALAPLNWVWISRRECRMVGLTNELADTLLHEAAHSCSRWGILSSSNAPDSGPCNAYEIASECMKGL